MLDDVFFANVEPVEKVFWGVTVQWIAYMEVSIEELSTRKKVLLRSETPDCEIASRRVFPLLLHAK